MSDSFLKMAFALHEKMWMGSEGRINRYHFFSREEGCPYAAQAAREFEEQEYPAVREAFLDLLAEFRKIEGEGFGR